MECGEGMLKLLGVLLLVFATTGCSRGIFVTDYQWQSMRTKVLLQKRELFRFADMSKDGVITRRDPDEMEKFIVEVLWAAADEFYPK